jgi:alpha-L-rhamnosidase
MNITRLKTNRIINPLGFQLGQPRLSWVAESEGESNGARSQTAAQVQVAADPQFGHILFDSGPQADIDSLAYLLPLPLRPATRYFWRVTVWGAGPDGSCETATSEVAWFETPRPDHPWQAQWITPAWEDRNIHPLLRREFNLPAPVVSARAYACGLGLYELEINGRRVGDERLAPGFNAYDRWLQYQTYDVTNLLQPGANALGAVLGNGWYKGRFGFEGRQEGLYGDSFALLCELVISCADGSAVVVATGPDWKAAPGPVLASSIYDGETYDANRQIASWSQPGLDERAWQPVRLIELSYERLEPRRSLPVLIKEELKPVAVIHTPAGETVLDMGQNMVGWLRLRVQAPAGMEIGLYHGEVLQDGNFFRDNLRSALAEYHYISDGKPALVEPHFTFYGFRYVKVTGWPGEPDPADFTGCVVYSDLEQTGSLETSNPLVNRLFLNALWGQKGNFLDVPTDCPQRDERMGWTGDAQVFSGTACYNMDVAAFFHKYLYDLAREQETRGGMVPMVVPAVNLHGGGACAWGDAATIIPWNVYLHYGDRAILEQQLQSMKAWVDFIRAADESSGGHRLWTTGFHFGDWLALDGPNPKSPMGGTAEDFIASAYYCYSAGLVARAAAVLGQDEIARQYGQLAEEVRSAIQAEYFTPRGRLAIDTQTALVLALYMDLAPPEYRARLEETLRKKLRKDRYHLKTGFVGTPYLCRVLSEHGSNDLAYRLLLNEDYPSWLYAVKMGATTIWERWNSLLPDGHIGDISMNSLNHYAYGSIVEWLYRHAAGLHPMEEAPGFRRARLAPQPDERLLWLRASLNSAAGRYESAWSIGADGSLSFRFRIPFNASARLRLPDARLEQVTVNGAPLSAEIPSARQDGSAVEMELPSGRWEFHYQPSRAYLRHLSSYTPLEELINHPQAREILVELYPRAAEINPGWLSEIGAASPRELAESPMMRISVQALEQLDERLKTIRL